MVSIRQIHPVFAGEVSSVDLTKPLSKAEVAAIEAGMDRYAVLVFRDQHITDDQQMAFTQNFGAIENAKGGNITKANEYRLKQGMVDVSNLDKEGKPLRARRPPPHVQSRQPAVALGFLVPRDPGEVFDPLGAHGRDGQGGNTEFADMRAAYDTLDDATRATIEDLVCEHSLIYSRGSMGFTELTADEKAMMKPVRQRLVRTHPVTGRKSLYLSSHAGTIIGWQVPEARDFLRDLNEHATQRELVYTHRWRQYDLVMWDNRQTMHRVRRFDESQPRDMRRTTVAGEAMTVAQAEPAAA